MDRAQSTVHDDDHVEAQEQQQQDTYLPDCSKEDIEACFKIESWDSVTPGNRFWTKALRMLQIAIQARDWMLIKDRYLSGAIHNDSKEEAEIRVGHFNAACDQISKSLILHTLEYGLFLGEIVQVRRTDIGISTPLGQPQADPGITSEGEQHAGQTSTTDESLVHLEQVDNTNADSFDESVTINREHSFHCAEDSQVLLNNTKKSYRDVLASAMQS